MTGEKLAADEVGTNVFHILFRTNRYPLFARRITEAASPASMAARRRRMVLLQPSLVMTLLGKHGYNIYKP